VLATIVAAFILSGAAQARPRSVSGVKVAICTTFGRYCSQALQVAQCESHYNIWARNGQYLGIFQMGSNERATYGHGNNAWAQARAAYRYFVASGRGWGPWECKPW
jgi:hypothetical protein